MKPYDECTIRSIIWFQCDYCGREFQRNKKSREKLRKLIAKDGCGDKACSNQKRAEVFEKKYGSTNLFATEHFKIKQEKTNIEKFGTAEYFSSKDFEEKRRETVLKKYGVESPLQNQAIRRKMEDTCEKKYGKRNCSQVKECMEKRVKTNLEIYGSVSPMHNEEVKKRVVETCLEKYGVEHYTQTKEYWEKREKTCLDRYGVVHPSQMKENRDKAKETTRKRYQVDNYSQTEECKTKTRETCLERYGVSSTLLLQTGQTYGKTQRELQDWLNGFGFSFASDYKVLLGKELDLYDPNIKIAIEYCGLFWHNEQSLSPRNNKYHYDKWLKCQENNIKLITLFEDEWLLRKEQCKGVLCCIINQHKERFQARKCIVREIEMELGRTFFAKHHLQGPSKHPLVCYGLYINDRLLGAMSLGRHHRQTKNRGVILDRMCFAAGIQVVGGAGKLFLACKKWAINNNFSSILTWSDNRWSAGSVYKILGFRLDAELKPDYSYVNFNSPGTRLSKQSQQKGITKCPADITEKEWALQHGLARIWDCGKKRWMYDLNKNDVSAA